MPAHTAHCAASVESSLVCVSPSRMTTLIEIDRDDQALILHVLGASFAVVASHGSHARVMKAASDSRIASESHGFDSHRPLHFLLQLRANSPRWAASKLRIQYPRPTTSNSPLRICDHRSSRTGCGQSRKSGENLLQQANLAPRSSRALPISIPGGHPNSPIRGHLKFPHP